MAGRQAGSGARAQEGRDIDVGEVGDFEKTNAFSYGAWVRAGRAGVFGAIMARMDEKDGSRGWDLWQNDNKLSVHIISQWPNDALKVTTAKPALRPGVWQHVFVTCDGRGKAGGVRIFVDGVEAPTKAETNLLKGSIKTATPTRIGQRSHTHLFTEGGVQDVRIYEASSRRRR